MHASLINSITDNRVPRVEGAGDEQQAVRGRLYPIGFRQDPFARWQGPLAEMNSLNRRTLVRTVPQKESFFGVTTLFPAGLVAGDHSGPWLGRACATSAVVVEHLAA